MRCLATTADGRSVCIKDADHVGADTNSCHHFRLKDESEEEAIDHPVHYNAGNIEVIDVIEDWDLSFNAGNAVKYIGRHMHKDKPVEDLEKARWYLDREIDRLKHAASIERARKNHHD